eukprot:38613-Chlamydomonas_euryale.AAC.7
MAEDAMHPCHCVSRAWMHACMHACMHGVGADGIVYAACSIPMQRQSSPSPHHTRSPTHLYFFGRMGIGGGRGIGGGGGGRGGGGGPACSPARRTTSGETPEEPCGGCGRRNADAGDVLAVVPPAPAPGAGKHARGVALPPCASALLAAGRGVGAADAAADDDANGGSRRACALVPAAAGRLRSSGSPSSPFMVAPTTEPPGAAPPCAARAATRRGLCGAGPGRDVCGAAHFSGVVPVPSWQT